MAIRMIRQADCCLVDGTCIDGVERSQCEDEQGGVFQGDRTTCDNVVCPSCPGDCNRDGDVGMADVLEVLANWGPCGEA